MFLVFSLFYANEKKEMWDPGLESTAQQQTDVNHFVSQRSQSSATCEELCNSRIYSLLLYQFHFLSEEK